MSKPLYWTPTPEGGVRPSTVLEAVPDWIARDGIEEEIFVSTIFLALDHDDDGATRDDPNLAPVLWESCVYGTGWLRLARAVYRSREDALAGHAALCRTYLGREPEGATHV